MDKFAISSFHCLRYLRYLLCTLVYHWRRLLDFVVVGVLPFFCASIFLVIFDFNFAQTNVQKMLVRSLVEWFLCAPHMKYVKRNSLNHISRMCIVYDCIVW